MKNFKVKVFGGFPWTQVNLHVTFIRCRGRLFSLHSLFKGLYINNHCLLICRNLKAVIFGCLVDFKTDIFESCHLWFQKKVCPEESRQSPFRNLRIIM